MTADDVRGYFFNATGFEPRGIKITSSGAVLVSFNDRDQAKIAKDRTNGGVYNNYFELEVYYFEPKELREINRLQEIDKRA